MDKTLIIDVRTEEEFKGGAYPGAINIPLDQFMNRVYDLGDRDQKIVVYCASGGRSAMAYRILYEKGFTNIKNGGGLMDMMSSYKD